MEFRCVPDFAPEAIANRSRRRFDLRRRCFFIVVSDRFLSRCQLFHDEAVVRNFSSPAAMISYRLLVFCMLDDGLHARL